MKHASLLALCSLALLPACGAGTVKETLGINRQAPDEFRVVSRPPLSVPPQFNLRPPSNSEASPTMIPADKQAQALVTGTTNLSSTNSNTFSLKEGAAQTAVIPVTASPVTGAAPIATGTASESQFLKNVGADKADPGVRDLLIEQSIVKQEKEEEASWWDRFTQTGEKKDALVDAKGEAERIRTNKDTGKPITEGQTPEVKDKDRGVLGKILDW